MQPDVKFQTHLFSYNYEGGSCVFEIKASSPEDARQRVSRLQYATYDGVLVARIKVPTIIEKILGLFGVKQ